MCLRKEDVRPWNIGAQEIGSFLHARPEIAMPLEQPDRWVTGVVVRLASPHLHKQRHEFARRIQLSYPEMVESNLTAVGEVIQ